MAKSRKARNSSRGRRSAVSRLPWFLVPNFWYSGLTVAPVGAVQQIEVVGINPSLGLLSTDLGGINSTLEGVVVKELDLTVIGFPTSVALGGVAGYMQVFTVLYKARWDVATNTWGTLIPDQANVATERIGADMIYDYKVTTMVSPVVNAHTTRDSGVVYRMRRRCNIRLVAGEAIFLAVLNSPSSAGSMSSTFAVRCRVENVL